MQTPILPASPETTPGRLFATACLFALPTVALTTSFGMTLIQLIILITSGLLMRTGLLRWYRQNWQDLSFLIIAFVGYFAISLGRTLVDFHGLSSVDGPLRMVFALSCIGFVAWLRPSIRYFWLGLCLGAIGGCLIALAQRFLIGMERAQGYTDLSITFGDLSLAMGLLASCALAGWPKEWRSWSFLPPIALACGIVGTILSSSRGAWLALPLVVPLLFAARVHFGRPFPATAVLTLTLLVVAYCLPATGLAQRFQEALSDVQETGNVGETVTTGGIRLVLWKASWMMFADHPLLGVGRDQFRPAIQQLAEQGRLPDSPALPYALALSSSHNDALHFLATGGLLDFTFLLLLYGAPLVFFRRVLRGGFIDAQGPALAGLVLVLCYIGFGLTDVMFWLMRPRVFYVMMVCVLAGFCLTGRRAHNKPAHNTSCQPHVE